MASIDGLRQLSTRVPFGCKPPHARLSILPLQASSRPDAVGQRPSRGRGDPQGPNPANDTAKKGVALPSGPPPPLGKTSSVVYEQGKFVELGEIIAAHGIKGEVKVDITTDSPKKRFGKAGTTLYLRPPEAKGLLVRGQPADAQPLMEMTTEGSKVQMLPEGKEIWIIKFKEVKDRTQAEQLRHQLIVLPLEQREALRDPDEFYVQDLVGCHVYMESDGAYVGKVIDLLSGFGTHDTLQLQLRPTKEDLDEARARTCMIPFVKVLVPVVDKPGKRILVSPPEGLMDLCSVKKIKPMDEAKKAQRLREAEEREARERQGRQLSQQAADKARTEAEAQAKEQEDDDDDDEIEEEVDAEVAAPSQPRPRKKPAGKPLRKLRIKPPSST